jgi:hypothetical protein
MFIHFKDPGGPLQPSYNAVEEKVAAAVVGRRATSE